MVSAASSEDHLLLKLSEQLSETCRLSYSKLSVMHVGSAMINTARQRAPQS